MPNGAGMEVGRGAGGVLLDLMLVLRVALVVISVGKGPGHKA